MKRHRRLLAGNNRMTMQLKNVDRKKPAELRAIAKNVCQLRETLG